MNYILNVTETIRVGCPMWRTASGGLTPDIAEAGKFDHRDIDNLFEGQDLREMWEVSIIPAADVAKIFAPRKPEPPKTVAYRRAGGSF